jgi:hypothetical protein
MDEARKVIERLERIDALREGGALPGELLCEIRGLLREGEAWLAAERAGAGLSDTERARAAIERCSDRLNVGGSSAEREVIGASAVYDR